MLDGLDFDLLGQMHGHAITTTTSTPSPAMTSPTGF
jgi:hypothetical protein